MTAPASESTLSCYLNTNRPFVMDPELDLETLLESYFCDSTCSITTKNMQWRCLALSSLTELHSGYMSYNSGLDYIVCHAREILFCKLLRYRLSFLNYLF